MHITKILKALTTAAPKDDVRYYLNTVYFERVKRTSFDMKSRECDLNYIICIVTNGHYLIKLEVAPEFIPQLESDGDTLLITRESLLKQLKNYRGNQGSIEITKDDGEWFIRDIDTQRHHLIDVCDGRFPDWRRIWREIETCNIPDGIGVSAKLLGDVCRMFSAVKNGGNSPMLMKFGDASSALQFTYSSEFEYTEIYRLAARLMPCRL